MTTRQVSFAIQGMYCARCAVTIGHALTQLDGLLSAYVNYATERATVTFDPVRIGPARMVDAVSHAGYSVPLDNITWYVGDLLYATSAATVQKVMSRCNGVVRVSADLASDRITLQGFVRHINRDEIENRLGRLRLGAGQLSRGSVATEFFVRMLVAVLVAFMLSWGALNRLGLSASVRDTPAAVLLVMLAMFGMFGAGWPFYRHTWAALRQGEFDSGTGIALLAAVLFLGSVAIALVPGTLPAIGWPAWGGLMAATALNATWFVARGLSLWLAPRIRSEALDEIASTEKALMTTLTGGIDGGQAKWQRRLLPPLVGVLGASALLGLYLGILSIAQSPGHALEQLAQDQVWVGLVALGFGVQLGMYTYLRLIVQALKLAGATAMTGVGTGTSTLGMLACCAHHLTDFAPLVALAGASGLSGAVTFLAEWKVPFIIFGLIVNAGGIVVMWRTICTSRAHLQMMTLAVAQSRKAAPGWH
jgi:copper chaperone CopZ